MQLTWNSTLDLQIISVVKGVSGMYEMCVDSHLEYIYERNTHHVSSIEPNHNLNIN